MALDNGSTIMWKSDRQLIDVWMLEVAIRMTRLALRCGRVPPIVGTVAELAS